MLLNLELELPMLVVEEERHGPVVARPPAVVRRREDGVAAAAVVAHVAARPVRHSCDRTSMSSPFRSRKALVTSGPKLMHPAPRELV